MQSTIDVIQVTQVWDLLRDPLRKMRSDIIHLYIHTRVRASVLYTISRNARVNVAP